MASADLISKARSEGRLLLTEVESKELLEEAGIPVVETRLATSKEEAINIAESIGFPVVLKIISPEVIHKSDMGGVKIGIADNSSVGEAYDSIMSSIKNAMPSASIHGISVQKMADPGTEVIIGASTDPQFGHVVMFGMGGVLVEVLKDVAIKLVPLTPRDAHSIVREIKSFPILEGYRGAPASDLGKLEEAILNLSNFLENHKEIKELDLNPVFCYPNGIVAVDARVVLEEN